MSFNSIHMAEDNHVDGVRITVTVASYVEAFSGVTWGTIADRFSGEQSYGNTKYTDPVIVAWMFKFLFNTTQAGREIGYVAGSDGRSAAFLYRLRRLNIKNMYKIYIGLVVNGLLPMDHLKTALTMGLSARGVNQLYRGKYFRYFCHRVVKEVLDMTVPKGQHPKGNTKVRQAAEALHVPLKTIRYWRDLKVIDIMIKH